MYCTSAVGIHTRIKHTMVAIAGRKMGWDGQKRRYVCYSCVRDYLRPRGALSVCYISSEMIWRRQHAFCLSLGIYNSIHQYERKRGVSSLIWWDDGLGGLCQLGAARVRYMHCISDESSDDCTVNNGHYGVCHTNNYAKVCSTFFYNVSSLYEAKWICKYVQDGHQ